MISTFVADGGLLFSCMSTSVVSLFSKRDQLINQFLEQDRNIQEASQIITSLSSLHRQALQHWLPTYKEEGEAGRATLSPRPGYEKTLLIVITWRTDNSNRTSDTSKLSISARLSITLQNHILIADSINKWYHMKYCSVSVYPTCKLSLTKVL